MASPIVVEKLIQLHREIQVDCGHDLEGVTRDCCPLDDLPGFDSLLIPGIVRGLARELGIPLPNDAKIKNIYVTDDGKRKHTIQETAEAFCRVYGSEGKKA